MNNVTATANGGGGASGSGVLVQNSSVVIRDSSISGPTSVLHVNGAAAAVFDSTLSGPTTGEVSIDLGPAGNTVTGNFSPQFHAGAAGEVWGWTIDLPGSASVIPERGLDSDGLPLGNTQDADASCTGTAAAPTAPPGKFCYYFNDSTNAGDVALFELRELKTDGVYMQITAAGSGPAFVFGTWAYTEPAP